MGARERLEILAQVTGLHTVTALAEAADIKPGTAQKHKDRDSIPPEAAHKYLNAAQERGVEVSFEWLLSGRGQMPTRHPDAGSRPVRRTIPPAVSKILPPDETQDVQNAGAEFRLQLWQLANIARGSNSYVSVLTVSADKVLAPNALRDFSSAFAIRMWDSSNGPYLPRGTILYVERPYGGAPGALCLFAAEATETEVVKPVVGILQKETSEAWHVVQDATAIELPKAEFKLCWRIRHSMRD